MITPKRLRELLDYDPQTGIFTWRINRKGPGARKGRIAGTVSPTNGYRYMKLDQVNYPAGALAFLWMTGKRPPEVDHINLVRDDNRWSNLRAAANRSQQLGNTAGWTKRKAPFKGVRFDKRDGYWYAQICQCTLPGRYETAEEAHAVYIEAAKKRFGEFARWDRTPRI